MTTKFAPKRYLLRLSDEIFVFTEHFDLSRFRKLVPDPVAPILVKTLPKLTALLHTLVTFFDCNIQIIKHRKEKCDNLIVYHDLKKDGAPVSWWKGFPNRAQTDATLLNLCDGFANWFIHFSLHIETPWVSHDLSYAKERVFYLVLSFEVDVRLWWCFNLFWDDNVVL